MLYKQTISPLLFKILTGLSELPEFNSFRLVGGTALSLQLGHRKSIDIDFFSDTDFDVVDYKKFLRKLFPNADIRTLNFGITVYLTEENEEVKIDLMQTERFIRPVQVIESIKFAHIEDIAAMKLEAITSRNTKKDFYDIAELLKIYSFKQLLNFYSEKYPYNDIKDVLENFAFFSEDCEYEYEPEILNNTDWLSVKFLLTDTLKQYLDEMKQA